MKENGENPEGETIEGEAGERSFHPSFTHYPTDTVEQAVNLSLTQAQAREVRVRSIFEWWKKKTGTVPSMLAARSLARVDLTLQELLTTLDNTWKVKRNLDPTWMPYSLRYFWAPLQVAYSEKQKGDTSPRSDTTFLKIRRKPGDNSLSGDQGSSGPTKESSR